MSTAAGAPSDTESEPTSLGPVLDGRLTDRQVEALRDELMTQWSGHRDVWGVYVSTDDQGRHFVGFDLGDNAQPFPDRLSIAALGGLEVPLRTCVVGRIIPY